MRENDILKCLEKHKNEYLTPLEIVEEVYVEVPKFKHRIAANNVEHHLSKLLKEDRVEERERAGGFVSVEREFKFSK